MKKNKKIVKPIEVDAHFKYMCPKCGNNHWVSLNEAKTEGFKIVCDCKKVFSPKRINKLQITYTSTENKSTDQIASSINTDQTKKDISSVLLSKCCSVLMGYGFTKQESEDMLNKAYHIDQSEDCSKLIKLALKSLGEKNND